MNKFLRNSLAVASLALSVFTSTWAGPVVIDGTDANDHGSFTSGSNVSGWLYMQHVLQNLAATVNPAAAKVVVDLGTTSGQARDAIDSAFSEGLPSGWILLQGTSINPPNFLKRRKFATPKIGTDIRRHSLYAKQPV